jgi:DNA-binding PadR family transcriptional regulator
MQEVEAMCGVRLGPGTLYAALARLEREGRVEALQADSDRRRPYRLTPAGRTWLREELRRMDSVVRAGLPRVARDA